MSSNGRLDSLYIAAKNSQGERAIWRAVIMQALLDAKSLSKKIENKRAKSQATEWLTSHSYDFIYVAILAGFDPAWLQQKVNKALERGCVWRKESAGKIYDR